MTNTTAARIDPRLAVELETYEVLDGRAELAGSLGWAETAQTASTPELASPRARLRVRDAKTGRTIWETTLPLPLVGSAETTPFRLPLAPIGPGYRRIEVHPDAALPPPDSPPDDADAREGRGFVTFVVLDEQEPAGPAPNPEQGPQRYLTVAREAVENVLAHHSARLGGQPEATVFVTTGFRRRGPAYRSLGVKTGDRYETFVVPELPFEFEPFRLDLAAWPVLDLLSELTGESRFSDLVTQMAKAFALHGFDPECGLGYLGLGTDFDVRRAGPACGTHHDLILFEPEADLPLGRLWAHAPRQMARMCRAAYYGLVTDPETMDYNRCCGYDFDDGRKQPVLARNSRWLAFLTTGAYLIHWWGWLYAQTADPAALAWSEKMLKKWQAVQHPQTGLCPYYFGGVPDAGPAMPPWPYARTLDAPRAAAALLDAAVEFRRRPAGFHLAQALIETARRLARGVARFGWDARRGKFDEFLHLDGRPCRETARDTFASEAERAEAARHDPLLKEVPVFDGVSFYRDGLCSEGTAGTDVPYRLAVCATRTRDGYLVARSIELCAAILAESRTMGSARNARGQWTFPATGRYLKAFVLLDELTRDGEYLEGARELADRELDRLRRVRAPDWWRVPGRNDFIEGLLRLAAALRRRS